MPVDGEAKRNKRRCDDECEPGPFGKFQDKRKTQDAERQEEAKDPITSKKVAPLDGRPLTAGIDDR